MSQNIQLNPVSFGNGQQSCRVNVYRHANVAPFSQNLTSTLEKTTNCLVIQQTCQLIFIPFVFFLKGISGRRDFFLLKTNKVFSGKYLFLLQNLNQNCPQKRLWFFYIQLLFDMKKKQPWEASKIFEQETKSHIKRAFLFLLQKGTFQNKF